MDLFLPTAQIFFSIAHSFHSLKTSNMTLWFCLLLFYRTRPLYLPSCHQHLFTLSLFAVQRLLAVRIATRCYSFKIVSFNLAAGSRVPGLQSYQNDCFMLGVVVVVLAVVIENFIRLVSINWLSCSPHFLVLNPLKIRMKQKGSILGFLLIHSWLHFYFFQWSQCAWGPREKCSFPLGGTQLSQRGDVHALGNVNVMSNVLHFSGNVTAITRDGEGGEEVNGLLQKWCIYIWNQNGVFVFHCY